MRISFILATLAASPLAVSAGGTLGFALGDVNPDNSCKGPSDYEADFKALAPYTKLVRTYSASQCNSSSVILPAAKAAGFKVLLGVWVGNGNLTDASYQQDFAALKASVPGYEETVYGITVGSEGLYRGDYDGQTISTLIKQTKSAFPSISVGTADSWNKWTDGTGDAVIQNNPDLILSNAFAYWQGSPINNATATYFDDIMQSLGHIQSLSGSVNKIHFMVGETGWETDGGTDYKAAKAGTSNAATFWSSGVCGMLDWGVDMFYFEAFDEPTKADATGQDGQAEDEKHWGAMTVDRTTKFSLSCK